MNSEEVGRYWNQNAEVWTRHARAGYDIYRDSLNTPAFFAILPDVSGLNGLDIGCGEGHNTRLLAKAGAKMTAIDIAEVFIGHARDAETAAPLGIDYQLADGTALPFTTNRFDFATAFMSLMDMPEQDKGLAEAARVLKPGGFLQFSILHPCFVPPVRKTLRRMDGTTRAIEISDYFRRVDGDIDEWKFNGAPIAERHSVEPFRIPRYHRTLSDWVAMIVAAGLHIEAFGEPMASEDVAKAVPAVEDTRVAPIFLHVRARKPA